MELMFVTALIAVVCAAAIPQVLTRIDHSRGYVAVRYLGGRAALARTLAVSYGRAVALRFEEGPGGVSFSAYQDGNRNGIRTVDIDRGIDRLIEPPVRLDEQFPGVAIALIPGMPGDDAVQLGRTDILSFSPAGTATSGTIYVRGGDGTQWAVRVLGATGRTRVLRYVPRTGEWVPAGL